MISEKIKLAMKLSGISQAELARCSGLTPVSISRYVNGSRIPKLSAAVNVANALGVSVDWLIGGKP